MGKGSAKLPEVKVEGLENKDNKSVTMPVPAR